MKSQEKEFREYVKTKRKLEYACLCHRLAKFTARLTKAETEDIPHIKDMLKSILDLMKKRDYICLETYETNIDIVEKFGN